MRISDWSSDACSSDLPDRAGGREQVEHHGGDDGQRRGAAGRRARSLGFLVHRQGHVPSPEDEDRQRQPGRERAERIDLKRVEPRQADRSEEHTSELQSLMRTSYAVFCLKKKTTANNHQTYTLYDLT